MRKLAILLFMLLGIGFAQVVPTGILEERDIGSETLPSMRSSLWTDCGTGDVTINLFDGSGDAIPGSTIFLFRTDSYYRLLARASTDEDGIAIVRPPGKLSFLNDMYVLRFEKDGYKVKEAEFTFWNCEEVEREYSEYNQPVAEMHAGLSPPEPIEAVQAAAPAPEAAPDEDSVTGAVFMKEPVSASEEPGGQIAMPCGTAYLLPLLSCVLLSRV